MSTGTTEGASIEELRELVAALTREVARLGAGMTWNGNVTEGHASRLCDVENAVYGVSIVEQVDAFAADIARHDVIAAEVEAFRRDLGAA